MLRSVRRTHQYSHSTCFVIASKGSDLGAIRDLLQARNLAPVISFELPLGGKGALNTLRNAIRRARFCIAFVEPGPSQADTFLQIGLARGLGKLVLIIGQEDLERLPISLRDFLVIKASPANSSAIGAAIDKVTQLNRIKAPGPRLAYEGESIGGLSDYLLSQVKSLKGTQNERQIIEIVTKALAASGISTIEYSPRPETTADLAIWSDDLESWTGNPLLIEIKLALTESVSIQNAAIELERYRSQSTAKFALIIYVDGPDEIRLESPTPTPVLFIKLGNLLASLNSESFAQIVRNLRDRWYHSR